jgi:hypothetical protein
MYLNNKHKKQFVFFYLGCFLLNFCWLFYNHLLLAQKQPLFFINYLDVTRNIFMLTGLHKLIVSSQAVCVLLDLLYLLLPCFLTYLVYFEKRGNKFLAIATSIYTLFYAVFFTLFSYIHIDYFIACVFIPLLFFAKSDEGFYYGLHSLRTIFIIIFLSAGLWKLSRGGVFNMEEMSGILVQQHKQYLWNNPNTILSSIYYFLIENKVASYTLYLLAEIAELVFAIGLFTKKYDHQLAVIFILFLIMDLLLMQISYFNWFVFVGLFYFSKYRLVTD